MPCTLLQRWRVDTATITTRGGGVAASVTWEGTGEMGGRATRRRSEDREARWERLHSTSLPRLLRAGPNPTVEQPLGDGVEQVVEESTAKVCAYVIGRWMSAAVRARGRPRVRSPAVRRKGAAVRSQFRTAVWERSESEAVAPRSRRRTVRAGAIIAVALAAGLAAWLLIRNSDDSPATETPQSGSGATITSTAELRALSKNLNQPIYWAGRRPSRQLELTRTSMGRVYIRYLPADESAGSTRKYLTVATYPFRRPLAALRTVARRQGTSTFPVPGGGIALETRAPGTSVYLAYPNENVQVEVFAPSRGVARRLATSGQVRPLSAQ